MTSAISVQSFRERDRRAHRRGFTLIELLVIIGIIAVLVALTAHMVFKAYHTGQRTIGAASLQTIETGLMAYKQDYGDFPRVGTANTGFAVLGKELVAPYGNGLDDAASKPNSPVLDPTDPPVYTGGKTYKPGDAVRATSTVGAQTYVCIRETSAAPASPSDFWAAFDVNDFRDGPGTSVRSGGGPRGPYLQPDRVRMRGVAILDVNDNPILYFPRASGRPNPKLTFTDGSGNTLGGYVDRSKQSLFDARDNLIFFLQGNESWNGGIGADPDRALKCLRMMMGDLHPTDASLSQNGNGVIDDNEQQLATGDYVLWSAGPDGLYGPHRTAANPYPTAQDISKCDDVTNYNK